MRAKKKIGRGGVTPPVRKTKAAVKKIKEKNLTTDTMLTIKGSVNGKRTPSRILEEQVQEAVQEGARELRVIADGQHGIGGRF